MRGRRRDAAATAAAAGAQASGLGAAASSLQAQLQRLRDAASSLRQSAAGRLPGPRLSEAIRAMGAVLSEEDGFEDDGTDRLVRNLLLVWGPAEHRAALLALLTAATHELTSDSARERTEDFYVMLSDMLGLLMDAGTGARVPRAAAADAAGEQPHPLLDTCLQTLELMVRMEFLQATSRLLAATRDKPQRLSFLVVQLMAQLLSFVERLKKRHVAEVGRSSSRSGGATGGRVAADVLRAFANSALVEHCVRTLLLYEPAGGAGGGSGSGGGGGGGESTSTRRQGRRHHQTPEQYQPDGVRLHVALRLFVRCPLCFIPTADGFFTKHSGANGSSSSTSNSSGSSTSNSDIRAILSGPNLQYAQAAHVVSQLAAADGGSVYGMGSGTAAGRVLPALVALPDARSGGGDGGRRTVLESDGIVSALLCWNVGFRLSSQVPLLPYGPREVYELSLRALRLVAVSAAAWAPRLPPPPLSPPAVGSSSSRQQEPPRSDPAAVHATAAAAVPAGAAPAASGSAAPGGGLGPAKPCLPLQAVSCELVLAAALRCAKAAARAAFGPVPGDGTQAGPAVAGAAARRRVWATVVPAIHGLIDLEAAGAVPMEAATVSSVLADVLQLELPAWLAGDLPPAPPPELSAALDAGYMPLLERACRAEQRRTWAEQRPTAAAAAVGAKTDPRVTAGNPLKLLYGNWYDFLRVLAYGEPLEVASLLSTATKLLREVIGHCGEAGGGAASSSSSSNGNDGASSLPSSGQEVDTRQLLRLERHVPLSIMFDWLQKFAASCRVAAATTMPVWAAQAAAGGAAVAAADGSMFVASAALLAGNAGFFSFGPVAPPSTDTAGDDDAAAAAVAATAPAPLQWSAGPTRQLLHMVWRAVQLWLPLASGAVVRLLQQRRLRGPKLAIALRLSFQVLAWVPPLVHAYNMARTEQGSESVGAAAAAAGEQPQQLEDGIGTSTGGSGGSSDGLGMAAEGWRQLLLDHVRVGSLLGVTLRRMRESLADGGGCGAAALGQDILSESFLLAYECLQAAFRSEIIGPAVPPYEIALVDMMADLDLAESGGRASGRRVSAEEVKNVRGTLCKAVVTHGSRPEGELPDPACWGCGSVTARNLGALLRHAAALPAPGGAVASLPVCSNPDCTNLEGDSEAGLAVQRRCRRCGAVAYCGAACQWAHWQGGHQQQCAGAAAEARDRGRGRGAAEAVRR